MKKIIVVLFLFSIQFLHYISAQDVRPNIILIIGDDISRDDIGPNKKNPFVKTPNLDNLARDGFLFNHFFVTSSSCSPSRTSLLTGRYPHNTGAAELHIPLPASQVYFSELLRNNGYYTALVGKFHEGDNTKRAYDTMVTSLALNGAGGEAQWTSILKNVLKQKPFFLWLSSYDAHREWDDNAHFIHSPDSVLIPPTLVDTRSTREDLAKYYGEVERLDYYIGEVRKQLSSQHVDRNTIIIFLGDNGRPFAGDKTRLYDRGLNTPLVIYHPKYKDAHIVNALVSGVDIAPTLLEWTLVPTVPNIQGKSFAHVLEAPTIDFRKYVFGEHNWHDYKAYERSVRTKHYLYIENKLPELANQGPLDVVHSRSFSSLKIADSLGQLNAFQKSIFSIPQPTEELYDVTMDTLNSHNLANDKHYYKIKNQLKNVLHQWQKETKDDFPINLTPDWYGRKYGEELPSKNLRGELPGQKSHAESVNNAGLFN